MTSFMIDCLGYLAQALFSARFFVQWIMSERAKRVLSPTIYGGIVHLLPLRVVAE